ncbi:MAG TPA: hypothetical protein DCY14_06355 [Anaerolineae bacterium]|nr:hypothetical protein [Anaerolineae bacterium]HRJ58250.1 endo-1,4-beta-xylanase [Anaerolineales bacterium]
MNKILLFLVLISLIITSCGEVSKPRPTATPTREVARGTSTPAVIVTPTDQTRPEPLAEAKDLPLWIEEFVHAYGGIVTVNNHHMDADQLLLEIQSNADQYIELKGINGMPTRFLVINGIPLAFQENGRWRESTMGWLGSQNGLVFTFQNDPIEPQLQQQALKKLCDGNCGIVVAGHLQINSVFRDFTTEDWGRILGNWDKVHSVMNAGQIPSGYAYSWADADQSMSMYKQMLGTVQWRAQHLLWPTIDNLTSSGYINEHSVTRQIYDMGFSAEENLKLLEFMVRSRVNRYPEIETWDVADEMVANFMTEIPDRRIWLTMTDLSLEDLIIKIAEWVKQGNPDSKTVINESGVFDHNNRWAGPIRTRTLLLLQNLNQAGAPVDGFVEQNNLWIGIGIDEDQMNEDIDYINGLGFELADSETMIAVGDISISGDTRKLYPVTGSNEKEAQAIMYQHLLSIYLSKGVTTFGFGGVSDANAWTNYNMPDADPLLFDDNFRPKPAYYATLQLLYEQLP